MSQNENRVRNIQNLVQNAERELRKAQSMLEAMLREPKNEFEDVPGTLGVYDGTQMVCADGKRFDVNPNYAAKSMLVVGDNLKMIEEEGKQIFKQISKVDRKKLAGILNKKEGSWYALTDMGSYKLLDAAVEFRRGQVNDEVEVLIPEGMPNIEFAALEKLAKEDTRPVIDEEKAAKHLAEISAHANRAEHAPHLAQPRHADAPVVEHKAKPEVEDSSVSVSSRAPRAVRTEAPRVATTKPVAPRSESPRAESPKPAPSRSTSAPRPAVARAPKEAPVRSPSARPVSSPRSPEAPRRPMEESRTPDNTQARATSVQSIVEDDDLV